MKLSSRAKRITAVGLVVVVIAILVNLAWQNQLRDVISLKTYLNDFRDVALAITQIVALLLVCSFIVMLTLWLSKSEGTIVLPFQNATGDTKIDGRGISDSLIAELQRIRQIHETEIEGVQFEKEKVMLPAWKLSTEDVSATIADVGAIGIGDTTVSVGKLLTTLKRMWPFGDSGGLITGSIQKYGPIYRLVARMEYRKDIRTWTVTRQIVQESEITFLIRDLAYKIAAGLSPAIKSSPEGFQLFSEALHDYNLYTHSNNAEDLARSEANCLEAQKVERTYKKIAGLFINLGIMELRKDENLKAVLMFESATAIDDANATSFFGLGAACRKLQRHKDAISAYQRAIKLGLKLAPIHNDLGDELRQMKRTDEAVVEYQKAIELNPKFASPHNGLGLVYYQLDRIDEAIAEFKKAVEIDPESKWPHSNLGDMYYQLNRTDEAIAEFKKA